MNAEEKIGCSHRVPRRDEVDPLYQDSIVSGKRGDILMSKEEMCANAFKNEGCHANLLFKHKAIHFTPHVQKMCITGLGHGMSVMH